jgi:hypothetical protein
MMSFEISSADEHNPSVLNGAHEHVAPSLPEQVPSIGSVAVDQASPALIAELRFVSISSGANQG